MSQTLIIIPVFIQAMLTFIVLMAMGVARQQSLRQANKSIEDTKLSGDKIWNEQAIKASNNFKNQFELPVLFYAVCAFALMTKSVDVLFLVLAFTFVLSRIAHSYFHLGSNRVSLRGGAYLVGFATLVAMWVILFARTAISSL
ncbi:MAG: MAPEG family protein [Pseudomonadota bacterium]